MRRSYGVRLLGLHGSMVAMGIAGSRPYCAGRGGRSTTNGWSGSGVRRGSRFPKSNPDEVVCGLVMDLVSGFDRLTETMSGRMIL